MDTGELERLGTARRLENQPAKALAYLIENRDRLVARAELIHLLWPGEEHGDFDHRLDKVIAKVRSALGESAGEAKFVETLRGRGLRFIAETVYERPAPPLAGPVQAPPEEEATVSSVATRAGGRRWASRWAFGLTGAVVLAGVTVCVWMVGSGRVFAWRTEANPEAERWDQIGMFELRQGTEFTASRAFEQAVALDPESPIKHAHLAEALWMSDLHDRARSEMLKSSDLNRERKLPQLDQDYIEALRATMVRDFPKAISQYRIILAALPESEKANGLEDLGRAYVLAAMIPEAIQCYEQAAKLQPSNAGAHLQLGVLHATQKNMAAADPEFARASALYEASSNQEGTATVEFDQGLMAAYMTSDFPAAERHLNAALDTSAKLSNPQLQARVLGALSTVMLMQGRYGPSVDYANREITVSQDSGENAWYADGVERLAEVAVTRNDRKQSEGLLKRSMDLALKVGNSRDEGNAELYMATYLSNIGDYGQSVSYAKRAHKAFALYSGDSETGSEVPLIVAGEAQTGDFEEALKDAQTWVSAVTRMNSVPDMEAAEEGMGDVYMMMGQDPEALTHYRRALDMARQAHSGEAQATLYVAAGLARLGRIQEAAAAFHALPATAKTDPSMQPMYDYTQAILEFGQGRYAAAIGSARKGESQAVSEEMEEIIASSELRLGQAAQAGKDADAMLAQAQKLGNPYTTARAELAVAQVALATHSALKAKAMAEAAAAYFQGKDMMSSEWVSLLCASQARKALGDAAGNVSKAQLSLGVLRRLKAEWQTEDFGPYSSRPDVRQAIRELEAATGMRLREAAGATV